MDYMALNNMLVGTTGSQLSRTARKYQVRLDGARAVNFHTVTKQAGCPQDHAPTPAEPGPRGRQSFICAAAAAGKLFKLPAILGRHLKIDA